LHFGVQLDGFAEDRGGMSDRRRYREYSMSRKLNIHEFFAFLTRCQRRALDSKQDIEVAPALPVDKSVEGLPIAT
jgi:hypothetical protein